LTLFIYIIFTAFNLTKTDNFKENRKKEKRKYDNEW